jgi:hypothetical protein
MKDFKTKGSFAVILFHRATHAVGMTRYGQQRVAEGVKL